MMVWGAVRKIVRQLGGFDMNKFMVLGLFGLLLVLAFGAGYVTRTWQTQDSPITDRPWLFSGPLPVNGTDGTVSYTPDALLEAADIPLPEIEAIDANVKFIAPPTSDAAEAVVIAYIAKVRVASLEKKNIPSRYLKERVVGPMTILPLEQVTYAVQFTFDLLDKDGFKLREVIGPDQLIRSGQTNALQEVTTKPLDLDLARRITKLRTHLVVLRCESCRAD
jgi:hypothetical protein